VTTSLISRILPLFLLGTALSAQEVQVRINDRLSSATAPPGEVFDGSLVRGISMGGQTCPKGSPVFGRVTDSTSSGRLSNPGVLELELTSIRCLGRTFLILADPVRLEGEPEAIVAWELHSGSRANAQPDENYRYYRRQANWRQYRDNDDDYAGNQDHVLFSERERSIMRACVTSERSGLPRGIGKRDRLPPGLEKQLRRNGTLPPGLQKKVQPLPSACVVELPRIPRGWKRVILAGRILLLNRERRIIDLFFLAG
jgi:hypothetical protein